jgi:hypothetical protein
MSKHNNALTADAVELLLDILESREAMLTGAAAELHDEAVKRLKAFDLLRPHGHEAVSAAMADHDDVPVSLTASECGTLTYFSQTSGPVAVPQERLVLYQVHMPSMLAIVGTSIGIPRIRRPMEIVQGKVWELGEARWGRPPIGVPVWFARRLWDPNCHQALQAIIRSRPHLQQRVVLTSTCPERLGGFTLAGAIVVSVLDVRATAASIAVNPEIMKARLSSVPSTTEAGPLALSSDGRELRIKGGPPIAFRSERQINAIRLLVRAHLDNERLPVSKLTDLGSLNRLFGMAKWKLLSPHLKSVARMWKFEV